MYCTPAVPFVGLLQRAGEGGDNILGRSYIIKGVM